MGFVFMLCMVDFCTDTVQVEYVSVNHALLEEVHAKILVGCRV